MGRSPLSSSDDNSGLKKGPWTEEEDDLLTNYIQKHGHGSWRALPKAAGLNRCGKSCRLRWTNYLRPDIKRGRFAEEEEDMIIKLHAILGNKWSRIATHLPGRTDNEIKNYWNTHLRKKLLQMGIDPVTHKPRTDDLDILANLSQLLTTPPNLGTLMNPWDVNNALISIQPNIAEIAKLQVLQNIFQILNTNTNNNNILPNNINQTIPLNLGMIPNLNNSNNICSSSQGFCQNPNQVGPSHLTSETYDNTPQSSLPKFNNNNNNIYNSNKRSLSNSYETLVQNRLPSLTTMSPEGSTIDGSAVYTTPADGDFFDGLEKLLDDGNSDLWKEFIKYLILEARFIIDSSTLTRDKIYNHKKISDHEPISCPGPHSNDPEHQVDEMGSQRIREHQIVSAIPISGFLHELMSMTTRKDRNNHNMVLADLASEDVMQNSWMRGSFSRPNDQIGKKSRG
ncbi:uncharacterized protein LOC141632790 [Silene latifolia]|uniref:uncharacterized protein LOC141632790 n=1 Tax=Silene latifolia TaxID=37657 RepID=UPI003D77BE2F